MFFNALWYSESTFTKQNITMETDLKELLKYVDRKYNFAVFRQVGSSPNALSNNDSHELLSFEENEKNALMRTLEEKKSDRNASFFYRPLIRVLCKEDSNLIHRTVVKWG